MKIINSVLRKPFSIICHLLVSAAPLAVANTACYLFWGEPECPDCLK
ncbi:cyclic lactone autoinducer peptide [Tissierella sp. MSJ-40]|uniref:Cyclic lactone autoinducer peptide n=1 Tax=Tissierella simiarum TaxID=2841534 RepID=A0ABS6E7X0_9FIRM|nr:cyclic lactone autoinducer peptide [Tissierella simiarum]